MTNKEFIESQVEYYGRHLRCGPSRDWNMIAGLLHYYEGLLRKINSLEQR